MIYLCSLITVLVHSFEFCHEIFNGHMNIVQYTGSVMYHLKWCTCGIFYNMQCTDWSKSEPELFWMVYVYTFVLIMTVEQPIPSVFHVHHYVRSQDSHVGFVAFKITFPVKYIYRWLWYFCFTVDYRYTYILTKCVN